MCTDDQQIRIETPRTSAASSSQNLKKKEPLRLPSPRAFSGLARRTSIVLIIVAFCMLPPFCSAISYSGETPSPELLDQMTAGGPEAAPQYPDIIGEPLPTDGLQLRYVLRGQEGAISFNSQENESDYFSTNYPKYYGDVGSYYRAYIENEKQDELLQNLANLIKLRGSADSDDAVRIAISLVQHLDYVPGASHVKYPYTTLIDGGDCDDKSTLLAYLLKKLGYGVALLYFEEEKHMSVGIRCSDAYDYRDTGYCFIEASHPSIMTDSAGFYAKIGKLTSNPKIIVVSNGDQFETEAEEFEDANSWNDIRENIQSTRTDPQILQKWQDLKDKYGLLQ